MIIQSSNMDMSSKRSYSSTQTKITAMGVWGSVEKSNDYKAFRNLLGNNQLGEEEKTNLENTIQKTAETGNTKKTNVKSQFRNQVLNYLLFLLFGKKEDENSLSSMEEIAGGSTQQGFGGFYDSSSFYSEQESTSFQTTGTVVTSDGRQIDFNVSLEMTRSFESYASTHMEFGMPKICDPLVINLDMGAAEVTDQKFLFDIDADGEMDEISMLAKGSGYLALDKDGNGKIDDGSELFGTASGDGFSDLEEYDIDKNGWIDEADEIFDKLRIWTKDQNGNDKLIKLKDAGVGAISLQNVNTQFALNSSKENQSNAYIRKTGIFLYETGGVGTVQHLDFVK